MSETKIKRKRGDRRDGVWLKNLDGMHMFMPYLMPNRTDSEVYLLEQVDVTELLKYVEKKNGPDADFKTTAFHAFVMAIGKTIHFRPYLNRFISGRRMYERRDISMSFVVKRKFEDEAEEMLLVMHIRPDMTITDVSRRIVGDATKLKKEGSNDINDILGILAKFPRFMNRIIMALFNFLDFHGKMPKFICDGDPNYTTVLLSNLGSIKCNAPYHHLNNYGTNSVMITIGEIHKAPVVNAEGELEVRDVVNLGCTVDERIADGFYFAKSIRYIKHLLANPEILDLPVGEEIDYEF